MHWSIDITSHEIVIFCHYYKGVKNLNSSSWYIGKLYWSKKTFSQWQGVSHLINCPAFSKPLPPSTRHLVVTWCNVTLENALFYFHSIILKIHANIKTPQPLLQNSHINTAFESESVHGFNLNSISCTVVHKQPNPPLPQNGCS